VAKLARVGRHERGQAPLGSDGSEPLPSGAEAMGEPFAAFPSWFLRIACDRCGKSAAG
jgi:hypothetical protein